MAGLALAACETVVDVDVPDHQPRLVSNVFLEAGKSITVALSSSQSILTKDPLQPVLGATLVLLEEGQTVATIEEGELGIYYSSFKPLAGKTYTLQITKEGYEPVEAETFIRPPVPIQAIDYDTTVFQYTHFDDDGPVTEKNITLSEVRLTIDDPADERNYYELLLYSYENYIRAVYDNEGNYVTDDTVSGFVQQYIASNDPAMTDGGGDFLEGEDEVYGEALTFGDEFLNGKTYTLRFGMSGSSGSGQEEGQFMVMLRSISEAQYRYFRSADLQYENDGNPFAEPVQVYSNVRNGYGIFTGFSADSVVINVK